MGVNMPESSLNTSESMLETSQTPLFLGV
jgi:hypothetical protein